MTILNNIALAVAFIAICRFMDNLSKLHRIYPNSEAKASKTIKVSDLPYGRRVSADKRCEMHTEVNQLLVEKNITVEPFVIPRFHLVNGIDVSNLMGCINEQLGEDVLKPIEVVDPVSETHVCDMIKTREIPATDDSEITIIGFFNGLRFDTDVIYIYLDTSFDEVLRSCYKSVAKWFCVMAVCLYLC